MPRAGGAGPMGLLHEARAREHEKYSGSMSPLSIANGEFLGAISAQGIAPLRARMEWAARTIAGELPNRRRRAAPSRSRATARASAQAFPRRVEDLAHRLVDALEIKGFEIAGAGILDQHGSDPARLVARSEERRVGKECRSRWSPYH